MTDVRERLAHPPAMQLELHVLMNDETIRALDTIRQRLDAIAVRL
jgi:hypothetical protein